MFVIPFSRSNPARATGQARFLADLWLETLASDVSPIYWPPLCSFLQLLNNLRNVLQEIDAGTLRQYHAVDLAAEILDRGELKPWLLDAYPVEWEVMKAELQELRKT